MEIGQEKVAYIRPAETTWVVEIRDGGGLSNDLFTKQQCNYYGTVEEAYEAAKRRLESDAVARIELSVVAKRFLDE